MAPITGWGIDQVYLKIWILCMCSGLGFEALDSGFKEFGAFTVNPKA